MPKKIGNLVLYNLEELSELVSVSVPTLRNYIRQGKLKAKKMGTRWYITEKALQEYFDENGKK